LKRFHEQFHGTTRRIPNKSKTDQRHLTDGE
jgi:hypothetical protein